MVSNIWHNMFMINESIQEDQYIVMPNHLHSIVLIVKDNADTLGNYIGRFKSYTTHLYNSQFQHDDKLDKLLWQRNYYDHIIINEVSLLKIRDYIANNPARWFLDKENPNRTRKDDLEEWIESL